MQPLGREQFGTRKRNLKVLANRFATNGPKNFWPKKFGARKGYYKMVVVLDTKRK